MTSTMASMWRTTQRSLTCRQALNRSLSIRSLASVNHSTQRRVFVLSPAQRAPVYMSSIQPSMVRYYSNKIDQNRNTDLFDSDSLTESDSDLDDNESDSSDSEEDELDEVDEEAAAEGHAMAAKYVGVVYTPTKVKKYSAELEMDGLIISGGHYWTALDAAKGYDELVNLYCDVDSPRNFLFGSEESESIPSSVSDSVTEWAIPDVGKRNATIIPPIPQTYLHIDEVIAALERENAIDIYTINLEGKSSLAEYMVFTTGRSTAHMRRMADMMIQSMKARAFSDEFEYSVEGRDCDDWMIADCNTIVVHFMQSDTRRILNLEQHWEQMVNDQHSIYGHMDEEEYMEQYGTSEFMEYIEEEDFIRVEPQEDMETVLKQQNKDIDWK